MLEVNKVYHGDCRLLIPQCADNYPTGIITDYPYGVDFQSNMRKATAQFNKILNDDKPFLDQWIKESYRILPPDRKGGGFFFTFYRWDLQDELFDELMSAGFQIKSQCLWVKGGPGMGDLTGSYGCMHENMVYATKGNYKFPNGLRPKNVYRANGGVDMSNSLVHPNEKPIWLMQAIIRDLTKPGDLIIEPFSGSGTTIAAAVIEKRRCIAFELDDRPVPHIGGLNYIQWGNKRVQESLMKSNTLF